MDTFYWNKNFITGLPEVDQQHKKLVDIINQLGEKIAEGITALDEVEPVFKKLADYAAYHFECEEDLMCEANLDPRYLDAHHKTHTDFLNEIVSIHEKVDLERPETISQLLDFLCHWLAFHILGTDQNIARQIKSIQSGTTPSDAYEQEEMQSKITIKPLLETVNALLSQSTSKNIDLVRLNRSLEAKVLERTRALSEANLHLEKISLTDVLTRLPNRRYCMRHLESLWEKSSDDGTPMACMMIDADHFKEVNDTYGHDAGDSVLCELARTLQHAVRDVDIVCRLGGDEFFIICPDTDQDRALNIAEKVRMKVSELRVPTGNDVWCGSISVGLGVRSSGMVDCDALIKAADNGVYEAKRAGKNCVRMAP